MSYADRSRGGSRVVALVIVALLNAVLGYAFVTGLAYQYVKKASEKLNTFDVEEPPPPPKISQKATARGNPGQYFGPDSYPPAALRAEAQGRVVASLTIGTDGRVTACTVTSSSGNSDLDDTTCRIARSRVRYTPAKDDSGNPIASTVTLPVRWQLPQ